MNVFEDLVVELQEENLLETTFNRVRRAEPVGPSTTGDFQIKEFSEVDNVVSKPERSEIEAMPTVVTEIEIVKAAATVDEPYSEPPLKKPNHSKEFYQKRAVGEISNLQMVEHVLTGVEREYLKIVPKVFDDFNVKKSLSAFMRVDENPNSALSAPW